METVELKDFGRFIRKKRKQLGLTQEYVAYKSGYSVVYINRVERGKAVPSIECFENLMNVFGLKMVIGVE